MKDDLFVEYWSRFLTTSNNRKPSKESTVRRGLAGTSMGKKFATAESNEERIERQREVRRRIVKAEDIDGSNVIPLEGRR